MKEENKCKHFDKTIDLEENYREYALAMAYDGSTPPPSRCFYLCKRYRECYCKNHYENEKTYKAYSKYTVAGKGTTYVMDTEDDLKKGDNIKIDYERQIIKGTISYVEGSYKLSKPPIRSLTIGVIIKEEKK